MKFESRNPKFNGKNVKLVSFEMEKEAIEYFHQYLSGIRAQYPDTDESLIGVPYKIRNLVVLRMKERELLDWHLEQLKYMGEVV